MSNRFDELFETRLSQLETKDPRAFNNQMRAVIEAESALRAELCDDDKADEVVVCSRYLAKLPMDTSFRTLQRVVIAQIIRTKRLEAIIRGDVQLAAIARRVDDAMADLEKRA